MRQKRIITLLFVIAACFTASVAETYSDLYLQQVGNKAILFSGNGQAKYPFRPENTYFLFGDQFRRGDITYGGICYKDVLLNVDAYLNLLYVKSDTTSFPVLMEMDKVSSFRVDGHRFIRAQDCNLKEGQLKGYVEEMSVTDDCMLLKKTEMVHYETTEGRYVSHHFEEHIYYYLVHDGILDKIRGKATFTKAFPSHKKALSTAWQQLPPFKKSEADEAYKLMFKTATEK